MMVRFTTAALIIAAAFTASGVRADSAINIVLHGNALIGADRSSEAVDRCGPGERAFVGAFQSETLHVSRNEFPRDVAVSPQGAPAVITIRRGDEVQRAPSEALNSRLRTAQHRDGNSTPVVDLAFDIRILGCLYLGGLSVTDFETALDGHAAFYRMTHRATLQSITADEGPELSVGLLGQELLANDTTALGADAEGLREREFGTLRFRIVDESHFFPGTDGEGGVSLGLSLTAFIDLESDGSLTP